MERVHTVMRSASSTGQALAWTLRAGAAALTRRHGAWGWCVAALSLAVCLCAWQFAAHAGAARALAQQQMERLAAGPQSGALQPMTTAHSDAQANLLRFEQQLLPHADIAQMVQDILQLAQGEGLAIERGDYRADPDSAGGFLRYRMQLPVRGKSAAVYRLIGKALRTHRYLTLESLQLTRERPGADVLDARIHWVALTQLPAERAR